MPEYLAPGVYVEETSFRAKSIEGVSTSIAGMIGPARYGPVGGVPELITSFTEYERMFGGVDRLTFRTEEGEDAGTVQNYLAFGARAFFDNGGTKLYVTRIFSAPDGADELYGHARLDLPDGSDADEAELSLVARFPGAAGNLSVLLQARLSENVLYAPRGGGATALRQVRDGDVVFVGRAPQGSPPTGLLDSPPSTTLAYGFYTLRRTDAGAWSFVRDDDESGIAELGLDPATDVVRVLTVLVSTRGTGRFDVEQPWGEFSFSADRDDSLGGYFRMVPESRRLRLALPFAVTWPNADAGAEAAPEGGRMAALLFPDLADALQRGREAELDDALPSARVRALEQEMIRATVATFTLAGGHDGLRPIPADYEGREVGNRTSGLRSFEDVEDVSILAAPGYSLLYADAETAGDADAIQDLLIGHAERMRYRIAVLDSGPGMLVSEAREQRARVDTTKAALYYPWITVIDPLADRNATGAEKELQLPPSGFVAGIYARNDVERGVHKAPANEVVRGAIGLETVLNKSQQDVLNPDGVNCFRYFEGRGYRLWGARTTSSDPEWKYVNVRRYFMYLERSIEKGTQWVVFENNSHELWGRVRRTVEDFLFNEWNNGALLGLKPEEAYFVRCDRSTMTQNDLDNGRLICLIGVAPVRPAEFVIFRIGQWTGDRKQ